MTVPLIDLKAQYAQIRTEILSALHDVLESQRFILGPEVETLEWEIGRYVDAEHAVGVASGTDALLLPLEALDVAPGSGVIVPSFTFFASAGAVWNAGLRPIFCDVDPDSFNVTADTLRAAWTDDTVAVVAVHLFGQSADMEPIRELTRERGAFLLEDGAQAIGASGPGGKVGSSGDSCGFSFFPTKNLGGFGDGGMVTTNDAEHADRVLKLRVHGGRKMYHHEMVGTNSRLDALQAAILRVKLRHIEDWTAARRSNARRYHQLLGDVSQVKLPWIGDGNVHVYNQFTIRAEARDALQDQLREQGIGTGIYYPVPLHLQNCFAELGFGEGDLPVSELLSREVLSLPIYPELPHDDQERVSEAIRAFYM